MNEKKNLHILVIRYSSIGDIVLCSPVFRALHNYFPNATIHFLTKSAYIHLLEANPNIHHIHALEGSVIKKAIELKKTYAFDLIIDLHHNLRSYLLTSVLSAPTIRFRKSNIDKQLKISWKVYPGTIDHVSRRALDTLANIIPVSDKDGLDFYFPVNTSFPSAILPEKYLAWAIGAQHFTKQLPIANIINTILNLDIPVVLLGGKEDYERAELICKATLSKKVVNACGLFTINQSALAIKNADLVLTNDTGMMHIAAALHKSIIVFWGNTSPVFGMYPYFGVRENQMPVINLEVENLNCRPCNKIGFSKCPKQHFRCMSDIRPQQIIESIHRLLTQTEK